MLSQEAKLKLKTRADRLSKEISENTLTGNQGLKEFSDYAGYDNVEDMLYSVLKSAAEDVRYIESNTEKRFY
jgi:hypothetical protein